jgi:hypothetical protein
VGRVSDKHLVTIDLYNSAIDRAALLTNTIRILAKHIDECKKCGDCDRAGMLADGAFAQIGEYPE